MSASRDTVYVGLDVGTQSARAMAVTVTGDVAGHAAEPLHGRRDGVRHEQDPNLWWSATAAACRRMLAEAGDCAVEGVAVCATSGTIALTDRAGAPLTPGLMYDDGRAVAEAERVAAAGAATWGRLGYRPQASWALPKLLWLLERNPPPGALLAHQTDVVTGRLVGTRVATDWSSALKTGYDALEGGWPRELLEALPVPDDALPDVVAPGTRLGAVAPGAADQTGLAPGTPVFAGMTDGCAAQVAAGALAEGSWNSVLGTTLVLKGVTRRLVRDPAGVVYSHRSPDGAWLPGAASSTGAGILAQRFPGRDLEALSSAAAAYEPAAAIAYPLPGRGERFPFAVPDAEGFVLGSPRDEGEAFAALLQGVAYVERLCFDAVDALGMPQGDGIALTGGAARNRYWSQLRADVLGRPVRLLETSEPALGAAILAASAGDGLAGVAARMTRVREVLEPRRGRERFIAPYLRLVGELHARGWLDDPAAEHARARAER